MKDLFLGGRLDAFIRQSSNAIAMFDREMRYLAVSDRWLADYRLPGSPIGRSHYEIFPEIGEAWKSVHRECLAGATVRSDGESFRRADGAVQWIRWEARPWRGDDGAVAGLVLTTEDFTEQKEQLADIERLASIVTSAHDAIASKDLASIVTSWNDGAARLFGWSAEEMIGTSIVRIIPAERRDEEDRILDRIRSGERVEHCETVRLTRDGRRIDVSLTISPVRDASGAIVGASKIVRDVTQRRRSEEALRASEVRLRQALAAAKAGEWEADPASGAFYASDRALALHGLAPGTPMTREKALAAVHPDDRDRVREALQSAVDDGSPFHSEHRTSWPDGTVRWVISHAEALAKPRRSRLIGLVQDVTERKAFEAELTEADRRKDEFIALLAHELRNPLAPIRSGVELFKMRGVGEDRDRALLDMMGRQVDHLVRLVDDLLDVSRINVGRIELRRRSVSVEESLRDAWSIVGEEAKRKPRPVDLTVACDGPVLVDADPVRLTQVFANLLSNAIKYTGDDGRIRVAIERASAEAIVTVGDNGMGIEPELIPRIFEAFVRGHHGARDDNGLGVGLALVKTLVELHGGRVEARSAGRGLGSEFVVRLPLAPEARAESPAPAVEPPAAPEIRPRVLVVDDDRDVADSFVMLLEVLGADVRSVYDGAAGVEFACSFRPHVAFVDLRMPGIDGLETARRIRQRLADRTPLLVAVTGLGQSEDRARCKEAGFDLHFTKPVSLDTLQQVLRHLRSQPAAA